LRFIHHCFPVRPPRFAYAPAEVDKRFFRNVDAEWPDRVAWRRQRRLRAKQAGHAYRSDSHRGGGQEPPAIAINLNRFGRTHR
jgi:hypothetical protein